jgi:hypothetical protein
MNVMFRPVAIILTVALSASAQVPAGVPFDPKIHPNPIVTWVRNEDFKTTPFADAIRQAGIEIMSLSQNEGKRDSLQLAIPAQGGPQRVRIMGQDVEVTFFPVVRQNYTLKDGKRFVMYSFRFPRALTSADVLNGAAFNKPRRPGDARFGTVTLPEQLEIRGVPGLIFDDGKERTIYWFEMGAGHSVTTDATQDELFRVLEDLL